MDFGFLGKIEFTPEFLAAFLSITLIDLVLAGDNAVVIAMAVQNLHGKQRKWGIILGAAAAVLLRVAATFVCAQLLLLKFVNLWRSGDYLDRRQAPHDGVQRGRRLSQKSRLHRPGHLDYRGGRHQHGD